jgi:ubiquinone/menaquinone biosynthesis C-methylase UbiE
MNTHSAVETYLQDFHQRQTGATGAAFLNLDANSAGVDYASSYAVLSARVPDLPEAMTVLDLACGDGYLLKLLADRQQPGLRLVGVDMSQGELDAARAHLPAEVTLLNERAQALSIETGTISCVVSHMALMLMENIEQVLGEVRRVLRPQGQLAAVVGRTFLLGAVNEVYLSMLRPILKEDAAPLPFGDRRTRTEAGWTELLELGFEHVQFEDVDVKWSPLPDELWGALTGTYDVDRLSLPARELLKARLFDAIAPLQQSDGRIATGWGLRLVHARAA